MNVASMLGQVGSTPVKQASYCASKGAVINLTRELALQFARRGVRVNALCPGWFPSEMTAGMECDEGAQRFIDTNTPMRRMGDAHELDGALLLLATRRRLVHDRPDPHRRRRLDRPLTHPRPPHRARSSAMSGEGSLCPHRSPRGRMSAVGGGAPDGHDTPVRTVVGADARPWRSAPTHQPNGVEPCPASTTTRSTGCAPTTAPSPPTRCPSPASPLINGSTSSQQDCLQRVVDGAYAFAGYDQPASWRGAPRSARSRPHLVVAGPTAGRMWGLRRAPGTSLVHVIAPPRSHPCQEPWVRAYRTSALSPDEVVRRHDGIRVTNPSRTAVDLTRYVAEDSSASSSKTSCIEGCAPSPRSIASPLRWPRRADPGPAASSACSNGGTPVRRRRPTPSGGSSRRWPAAASPDSSVRSRSTCRATAAPGSTSPSGRCAGRSRSTSTPSTTRRAGSPRTTRATTARRSSAGRRVASVRSSWTEHFDATIDRLVAAAERRTAALGARPSRCAER